jgi:hypothetical protein
MMLLNISPSIVNTGRVPDCSRLCVGLRLRQRDRRSNMKEPYELV